MTKDEALKLALEALEWINRVSAMDYEYQQKARESLNAIYEALAEQPVQPDVDLRSTESKETFDQQEPVGQLLEQAFGRGQVMWFKKPDDSSMLYTTPPQGIYYTTPPQRKPLTDEEIGRIAGDSLDAWSCARAIEAAHGIKE